MPAPDLIRGRQGQQGEVVGDDEGFRAMPACSGTQLVAAERAGRRCFAMELDPVYCDVAVRRWERATGREALKAS